MAETTQDGGDPKLRALFVEFGGHLVSPAGAAALLGLSRKTIHTLGDRGTIRMYRSDAEAKGRLGESQGPRWVLIPLVDLRDYADQVGRPFPELAFGADVPARP